MEQHRPRDAQLPGLDALYGVCRIFGADPKDARLLHHRSNAVYLLPHARSIVRLAPDTPLRRDRAITVMGVTRWLATQPGPIALPPMPGEQPVLAAGAVATFWPYRPTVPSATLADLAAPLRRLHALPDPPVRVPRYRPLHRLHEALALDGQRRHPALTHNERAWLTERADELVDRFITTHFPLGDGLVHADVHTENLLRIDGEWVLIDWDQTCIGPRELDLLTGLPDHFHEPSAGRMQFLSAYGYDILDWPDWTLLRDITELHSLAAYIRLAASKPAAATELRHRLRSLRTGDTSARWHAIS